MGDELVGGDLAGVEPTLGLGQLRHVDTALAAGARQPRAPREHQLAVLEGAGEGGPEVVLQKVSSEGS